MLMTLTLVAAAAAADPALDPAPAPDSPYEGHWALRMERANWAPRVCRASLHLAERDGVWTGRIMFDLILGAAELPLRDLVIDGDGLACSVEGADQVLELTGRLDDGRLEGSCAWKDLGEFAWSAKRSPRQPRFEIRPTGDAAADAAAEARRDREPEGVDAIRLDELIIRADRTHSDALVVLKDGKIVCERYFRRRPSPIEAMSATKSVVGLAVGLLIDEGRIESIDTPVHAFYPQWSDGPRQAITIRHLLTHTSGLQANRTTEEIYASDDFVALALAAEVTTEPGSTFFYNNKATNLLAGVVEQASGERLDVYLGRRLFQPLGIDEFTWTLDPAGTPHAMAGLQIHAMDLARIGQLMLDGGRHGGEQILSEAWVTASTSPSAILPKHGLLWWLHPSGSGFSANGYLGQYLVVVPEHRIVAVRQRRSPNPDQRQHIGPDMNFPRFEEMVRALVPAERVGGPPDAAAPRRALVIGIDGLRPDMMVRARTPSLDRLMAAGAVSLTATNCYKPENPWNGHSATNWGALLTGRRPDTTDLTHNGDGDHLVDDDGFGDGRFRSMLGHLKHHDPSLETAVFNTWGGIGMAEDTILEDARSVVDHHFHPTTADASSPERDIETTDAVVDALRGHGGYAGADLDAVFVHLSQVDSAGHSHAYDSPEYLEAVERVDGLVGRILDAIELDEWLIVVSSDHGGPDGQYNHADNTHPQTLRIPFVICGGGIEPGSDIGAPSLYDVTPTVLEWMGVDVEPLDFEGIPVARRRVEPVRYRGRNPFEPMAADLPPLQAVTAGGAARIPRYDMAIVAAGVGLRQTVADIGCGSGRLTVELARAAGSRGRVLARDITDHGEAIRARSEEAGVRNIEFAVSEPGDVGLPAGSIDVALLADVYQIVLHQPETKGAFLDSIHAALEPGGVVVVAYVGSGHLSRADLRARVIRDTIDDFTRHGFVAGQRYVVATNEPQPVVILEFQRP